MTDITDFRAAEEHIIKACEVLLADGFTDEATFVCLVQIYLAPWFEDMEAVARRLALGDDDICNRRTDSRLSRMRDRAHGQLRAAIAALDPRAAAKAATFVCGIQLAAERLRERHHGQRGDATGQRVMNPEPGASR
jgi:hypothetical protein